MSKTEVHAVDQNSWHDESIKISDQQCLPQHPHNNINTTTLPLEERHYSIKSLLTVKKAEKSLKKRGVKDRSGTTWDFKRATVPFRVDFINVEGLKSKLQSRDF